MHFLLQEQSRTQQGAVHPSMYWGGGVGVEEATKYFTAVVADDMRSLPTVNLAARNMVGASRQAGSSS